MFISIFFLTLFIFFPDSFFFNDYGNRRSGATNPLSVPVAVETDINFWLLQYFKVQDVNVLIRVYGACYAAFSYEFKAVSYLCKRSFYVKIWGYLGENY